MNHENELIKKSLTKDNVYVKEQEDVLNNIFTILGLKPNDSKSTINKELLEIKNEDIVKLFDKIKIYYSSTLWSNIKATKKIGMSIIRTILKYHGYKLHYKIVSKKKDNSTTTQQLYYIIQI